MPRLACSTAIRCCLLEAAGTRQRERFLASRPQHDLRIRLQKETACRGHAAASGYRRKRFRAAPTAVADNSDGNCWDATGGRGFNGQSSFRYNRQSNIPRRAGHVLQPHPAAVARGEAMMTLTGGGTGIGKTFEARQICRRVGIEHCRKRDRTASKG